MNELVQQTNNVSLIIGIALLNLVEDFDLRARLEHEGFARLDDFDSYFALVFLIVSANHLSKGTLLNIAKIFKSNSLKRAI